MIHIPIIIIGVVAVAALTSCQQKETEEEKKPSPPEAKPFTPVTPPPPPVVAPKPVEARDSTNILKADKELTEYLLKAVANTKTGEGKIKSLIKAIIGKGKMHAGTENEIEALGVIYNKDPEARPEGGFGAVQLFKGKEGKRYAQCLELSILFVTMARIVGLEASVADVIIDANGDLNIAEDGHVCAVVKIGGKRIFVDLTVENEKDAYDIKHQDVREMTDQEARARFHKMNGIYYVKQNKYDMAKKEFQKAIEISPNSASAHTSMGTFYGKHGNYGAQGNIAFAQAEFVKAIELDPKYAAAHYNLASTFFRQGRDNLAIGALGKALEIYPEYTEARLALGKVYVAQGSLHYAIDEYRKVAKQDRTVIEAYTQIYSIYEKQKNLAGAEKDFKDLVTHNSEDTYALQYLVNIYEETDRLKLAAETCDRLVEIYTKYGNTSMANRISEKAQKLRKQEEK
jgi:tetratricopeptide (TPR) repeat protein